MTKIARVFTLVGGCAVAMSLFAITEGQAQSRRELAQQLDAVEQRLAQAEQRLASMDGSDSATVRLFERIDSLEVQLATVSGQVEQLSFANQQLCRSLRITVQELQIRDREYAQAMGLPSEFAGYGTLTGLFDETAGACAAMQSMWSSGASAGGAPGGTFEGGNAFGGDPFGDPTAGGVDETVPAGPQSLTPGGGSIFDGPQAQGSGGGTGFPQTRQVVMPNNPDLALQQAQQLILGGRYDEAEALLSQFVERFAGDPIVAEGYFLRGETYYVRDAYSSAAADYIAVIETDRVGPSAPEALVKLASSLNRMGVPEEACLTLDGFDTQYPDAEPLVQQKAERARLEAGCG